jgi:hypothetical protein
MTRFALGGQSRKLVVLCALLFPMGLKAGTCSVGTVEYKGWNAVQIVNGGVKIILVPQLGGRVMQVEFQGHEYLFVNPRYAGKYIPPEQAKGDWINYGGDKIWPMPEGNEDEQHWVLESGVLDDGVYTARTLDQGQDCTVEMTGPADPITGLQYSRQISVDAGSTAIHFHAVMRNATAHAIHWSMQSVSQYNLASATQPAAFNQNFWAYTEANPASSYLSSYHVRSGLADDPSFSVKDGLFRLHWMDLANEVWVDSTGGWLAVADGESGFGMVERFHYESGAMYPGKATVIFYKNGPSVDFNDAGEPQISAHDQAGTPYYMEAEVNSPIVTLAPNAAYALDTTWYPMRTDPDVKSASEAGVVTSRLQASVHDKKLKLSGVFGVVASGHLEARLISKGGRTVEQVKLDAVGPENTVRFDHELTTDLVPSRVSLHLIDAEGRDLGSLDVADVQSATKDSSR